MVSSIFWQIHAYENKIEENLVLNIMKIRKDNCPNFNWRQKELTIKKKLGVPTNVG